MDCGGQPHSHDKLFVVDHAELCDLVGCHDELLKSHVAEAPELKKMSKGPLLSSRLALEECISYASDGDDSLESVLACFSAEGVDQARLEWQQARELEAAVTEQEERLRSMRAEVASEIERELQRMHENGSAREDLESSALEENMQQDPVGEMSKSALAEQKVQMQQKWTSLQDELASSRQYLRVTDVKAGDLAKRRRSVLPVAFQAKDS